MILNGTGQLFEVRNDVGQLTVNTWIWSANQIMIMSAAIFYMNLVVCSADKRGFYIYPELVSLYMICCENY